MSRSRSLEAALNSIGKACFARHFALIADETLSNTQVAQRIASDERYSYPATNSRVSSARWIINSGQAAAALDDIQRSKRVAEDARDAARGLLTRLSRSGPKR
ncbi:MAG: hypothetical protein KDJ44_06195 [Rhodoblastus sp.]|nr:hypothetical protein [Rhodoblastus sp.]